MLGFVCFALGKGEPCIFELVFDLLVRERGQIKNRGRGKMIPKITREESEQLRLILV